MNRCTIEFNCTLFSTKNDMSNEENMSTDIIDKISIIILHGKIYLGSSKCLR